MYDPKGNGKEKAVEAVQFVELEPPAHLRGIVHRFLELKTDETLPENYRFHALPDACTYIVFDQLNRQIAGVSRLRAGSEEFNLGKRFHFINIRFLPGVWQGDLEKVGYGLIDKPYGGALPLLEVNNRLATLDCEASQLILVQLVEKLMEAGMLAENRVAGKILHHIDDIQSVADMAKASGLSARQLQRTLKRTTGFTPHDLLKVLRLQQTLNGSDIWSYADQSHFIHSFRKATGYTPGKYHRKFDV